MKINFYTAWGAPQTVTANGHLTQMSYNAQGLTAATSRDGVTLSNTTYDEKGRVATQTDQLGMTVAYRYNNLDHVTREKYPDGTSVTYDYTCCGLPGIVTDRAGRKSYYDYDPLKRLARVQNAKGDTLQMDYDAEGNLVRLLDGKGSITKWQYNGMGALLKKIYADGSEQNYAYAGGRLSASKDARNRTTQFGYDNAARLTIINARNSNSMKTFQICLLAVVLAIPVLPIHAADAPIAKVPEFVQGQRAPSINIVDANGKRRILADMRFEKRVLLTFFPKCFTGTCASQLTSLRDSYAELQKQDVQVWAISTDAAEGEKGQRAFARELKLPFPLLPDIERTISLAYGAAQSKEQMAARMSILVSKNSTIEWVDKQIDPRNHGADVLARIKADDAKVEK